LSGINSAVIVKVGFVKITALVMELVSIIKIVCATPVWMESQLGQGPIAVREHAQKTSLG
jgi:hypothetical protein